VVDLLEQPAVVVLTEHKEFDAEDYEKDKAQMKQQVLRQKREQTFSQWFNELVRQAEEASRISVNPSLWRYSNATLRPADWRPVFIARRGQTDCGAA
jgi:hypothetical protein